MKIKNLCPHPVCINGEVINPEPTAARTNYVEKITGFVPDTQIPIVTFEHSGILNLPEPQKGVILIVSQYVARHTKDRPDVYYPAGQRRVQDSVESARGLANFCNGRV